MGGFSWLFRVFKVVLLFLVGFHGFQCIFIVFLVIWFVSMVFKVGSWKFHGRLVVFLGSSCTIVKYGEMMFYNMYFSSDSNERCDCKRCFYQTYSNPVNAIVSFCGNSTEVFLRVNFQTAPGLMFFIIRKFILIKNTKSYKSSKLLKVVKQLEEEYDK